MSLSRMLTSTRLQRMLGRLSLHCRNRVAGSAAQLTAPTSICSAAWIKTSTPRLRFGGTTRSATLTTQACHPIPFRPTSMLVLTSTGKSTVLQDELSARIFMSRYTTSRQIAGRWLQTIRLPTIASWQPRSATTFTRAAATPPRTKPGAMIQARTPGSGSQPCLRAARLPPPELTTAGGYLQEATLTSPLAPARLPGTRPRTRGVTSQTCCRPAITSQAQSQANPSTPSPATRRPELVPMTTRNTPKPPAAHLVPHQVPPLLRLQLRAQRHQNRQ